MPVTQTVLALFALLASTASEDLSAADDDDSLYIIHEFDADYFERRAENVGDVEKPKPDAVYTVEYVATKEELDAEREFSEKYGISIDYLRKVQQRAKQGSVGRMEAENSDSSSKGETSPAKNSKVDALGPGASTPTSVDETKEKKCDPPHLRSPPVTSGPEPMQPWKSPTRAKAASRPDNGAALVIFVVVVIAVVLTAFIVIVWCSYSCLV